ncbi:hypothetical protein AB0L82_29460 [Nocardia sp. NPDC052001]|uniref:hypothetical protein n=1 Tax=Nocardia sp. NPDC052001 TaxID=3154853 RepID=UPI0034409292
MKVQSVRARRAGMGVTAFGALAATMVMAAPQAGAWVGNLQVDGGAEHKTGCSYTVTASVEVDRLSTVKFTDNGVDIPGSPVAPSLLSNKVTIKWTPTTVGNHKLEARQILISDSINVQVTAGSNTGSLGCGGGLGGLIPTGSS